MDPLTIATGVSAVAATAGLGAGLRLGRRLRRAEAAASQLRRDLQAARHAANHDSLTGLPNRRAFHRLGAALVADPVRPAIACVVVDLNSLKQINDTLGHAAGDRVLVAIAGRLATYAGDDLVARLGGDEFAGLFTSPSVGWRLLYPAADGCEAGPRPLDRGLRSATPAGGLAEMLAAPMSVAGRSLRVTAAIGVAPVTPGAGLAVALHQADCAMYRAKATGAGVAYYHPALDEDPSALREAALREAALWEAALWEAWPVPPAATTTAPGPDPAGLPRSLVESARGTDEAPW